MTTLSDAVVDPVRKASTPQVALVTVAALLGLSALIHLYVLPEHLHEWLPAAVFFALVAGAQLLAALAVVRWPTPAVLLSTLVGTLGLVGTYIWSRTAGLPFMPVHSEAEHAAGSHVGHAIGGRGNGIPIFPGPAPSSVEAVGTPDLISLFLEVATIAIVACLLPEVVRRRTTSVLLGCALALLVLRVTVLN
jgi:hypothetical protein